MNVCTRQAWSGARSSEETSLLSRGGQSRGASLDWGGAGQENHSVDQHHPGAARHPSSAEEGSVPLSDGLLHLIHDPDRLAFVSYLSAGCSFAAIAADQLNVVIRSTLSSAALHSYAEFQIRNIGAGNFASACDSKYARADRDKAVLDGHAPA